MPFAPSPSWESLGSNDICWLILVLPDFFFFFFQELDSHSWSPQCSPPTPKGLLPAMNRRGGKVLWRRQEGIDHFLALLSSCSRGRPLRDGKNTLAKSSLLSRERREGRIFWVCHKLGTLRGWLAFQVLDGSDAPVPCGPGARSVVSGLWLAFLHCYCLGKG